MYICIQFKNQSEKCYLWWQPPPHLLKKTKIKVNKLFNRPRAAGAVLQTPLSLPFDSLSDPFVKNLQDTVNPKL